LQTLLKIIQRELMSMDRSSWTFWRGFGASTSSFAVAPAAAPLATTSTPDESVLPGNGHPPTSAPKNPPQQPGKKRRK
jgi:hypothetical protein